MPRPESSAASTSVGPECGCKPAGPTASAAYTEREFARHEIVRAQALCIAYKAAIDDEGRSAVVAEIKQACRNAEEAMSRV